ncbi:hypothetical protein DE146DRAFT_761891 [Phaeosphaeria sp. MPI-PUGE-AT-0046c]|nr:hypothetical protein DE146DRAFT_761891 [Phaeosphaeria sp. MPI-PUGE-AT-0046c]
MTSHQYHPIHRSTLFSLLTAIEDLATNIDHLHKRVEMLAFKEYRHPKPHRHPQHYPQHIPSELPLSPTLPFPHPLPNNPAPLSHSFYQPRTHISSWYAMEDSIPPTPESALDAGAGADSDRGRYEREPVVFYRGGFPGRSGAHGPPNVKRELLERRGGDGRWEGRGQRRGRRFRLERRAGADERGDESGGVDSEEERDAYGFGDGSEESSPYPNSPQLLSLLSIFMISIPCLTRSSNVDSIPSRLAILTHSFAVPGAKRSAPLSISNSKSSGPMVALVNAVPGA